MAARQWAMDNLTVEDHYKDGNYIYCISFKELQQAGYLEDKSIVDALNNEEIELHKGFKIKYKNNQFIYEYTNDRFGCDPV